MTQHLPPAYARRLLDAAAGSPEDDLRAIAAQDMGEQYFREGGRASGPRRRLQDIDYLDLGG